MGNPNTDRMNNTGHGPLQIPGFGLPVDHELPAEETFAHGLSGWRQSPVVNEHELAMVQAMNLITDLSRWAAEVTRPDNKAALQAWRKYVRPECRMTDRAWEWCIQELRDKAADMQSKGFVTVLDTGSVVCKSDVLLQQDLVAGLAASTAGLFERAKSEQSSLNAAPAEVTVVEPYMHPLVNGRTRVLQRGGTTGLDDLFGGDSKAEPAPTQVTELRPHRDMAVRSIQSGMTRQSWLRPHHESTPRHEQSTGKLFNPIGNSCFLWSPHFQSLPCEVEADGNTGVRITSYINNLHPNRNRDLYRQIEKLIALSVEPWNACLIKGCSDSRFQFPSGRPQKGRVPARIPTMGRTWINELPLMALSFSKDRHPKESSPGEAGAGGSLAKSRASSDRRKYPYWHWDLKKTTRIPSVPTPEAWAWAEWYLTLPDDLPLTRQSVPCALPDSWQSEAWQLIAQKATRRHDRLYISYPYYLPDPGMTLSYKEWRSSQYDNPSRSTIFIRPIDNFHGQTYLGPQPCGRTPEERLDVPFYEGPVLKSYEVNLRDPLRTSGLQVIVKIGGLALTPNNPQHEADFWSFPTFYNEPVVATVIAVISVENLSACSLELRQETSFSCVDWPPNLDDEICTFYRNPSVSSQRPLATQSIGKVELREGRFLTFSTVMESRLGSCHLLDPASEGHLRFVSIYLVDPNYRICSTRNVPAQQYDWWADEVFPILHQQAGLPVELCDMILKYCDGDGGLLTRRREAAFDRQRVRDELEVMHCAKYARMKP